MEIRLVYFPWEWYGNTAGEEMDGKRLTTLPSYWLEFGAEKGLSLGDEFKIRPSATYSEPSYAGFICLALFFIMSGCNMPVMVFGSFVLAMISVLLCSSASGILVICAFAFLKYKKYIFSDIRAIFIFVVGVALTVYFSDVDRIINIGDMHGEASGFIRIVKPLINIFNQFSDGYIFGLPEYLLNNYHSDYYNGVLIGKGLDNGVFNIIMEAGVMFPVIFWAIFRLNSQEFFLFLFLGAMINGSPFSFDKAFIFFISATLHKNLKS